MTQALWNLVLAGGQGRRLCGVTQGVPKQFWSPADGATMVEQTVSRLAELVPPTRTVSVIGPGQASYLHRVRALETLGTILEQPADKGTGIAVLWGLSWIRAINPEALVIISPADHGIVSVSEFRDGVRVATTAVSSGREAVILFGVSPASPAQDYGWIVPEPAADAVDRRLFRRVYKFAEKPGADEACRLMALGALWNTMVMVGRVSALINLFSRYAPIVTNAAEAVGLSDDDAAARFMTWPVIDLSHDVLSGADNLSAYAWRPVLGWCDLGTEERLREWQQQELWAPAARRRAVAAELGVPRSARLRA
jgi:mannose-1-phosphate guanylyltransferase